MTRGNVRMLLTLLVLTELHSILTTAVGLLT
jgi:hypothetical protein